MTQQQVKPPYQGPPSPAPYYPDYTTTVKLRQAQEREAVGMHGEELPRRVMRGVHFGRVYRREPETAVGMHGEETITRRTPTSIEAARGRTMKGETIRFYTVWRKVTPDETRTRGGENIRSFRRLKQGEMSDAQITVFNRRKQAEYEAFTEYAKTHDYPNQLHYLYEHTSDPVQKARYKAMAENYYVGRNWWESLSPTEQFERRLLQRPELRTEENIKALTDYYESVNFYMGLGYPELSGKYAAFVVPEGTKVKRIIESQYGGPSERRLDVSFVSGVSEQPKSLAQQMIDINIQTRAFLPKISDVTIGATARVEKVTYGVAGLLGVSTPIVPPEALSVSGGLKFSPFEMVTSPSKRREAASVSQQLGAIGWRGIVGNILGEASLWYASSKVISSVEGKARSIVEERKINSILSRYMENPLGITTKEATYLQTHGITKPQSLVDFPRLAGNVPEVASDVFDMTLSSGSSLLTVTPIETTFSKELPTLFSSGKLYAEGLATTTFMLGRPSPGAAIGKPTELAAFTKYERELPYYGEFAFSKGRALPFGAAGGLAAELPVTRTITHGWENLMPYLPRLEADMVSRVGLEAFAPFSMLISQTRQVSTTRTQNMLSVPSLREPTRLRGSVFSFPKLGFKVSPDISADTDVFLDPFSSVGLKALQSVSTVQVQKVSQVQAQRVSQRQLQQLSKDVARSNERLLPSRRLPSYPEEKRGRRRRGLKGKEFIGSYLRIFPIPSPRALLFGEERKRRLHKFGR